MFIIHRIFVIFFSIYKNAVAVAKEILSELNSNGVYTE